MSETGFPHCPCCGGHEFSLYEVVWDSLASAWGLTPLEREEVNLEQGWVCTTCWTNLRSMALAAAILRFAGYDGLFADFVASEVELRVLEVNGAGDLPKYLARLPARTLVEHPAVDMCALPFRDGSFDLVVHSDTLEHVSDPVGGLRECRRVLADRGACCFTVPLMSSRVTRSRQGLAKTYHGTKGGDEYLVETEFGPDVWRYVLAAGFASCTITALHGTSGLALTAR